MQPRRQTQAKRGTAARSARTCMSCGTRTDPQEGQLDYRPSSRLRILPVAVMGRLLANSKSRGYL
jgi:hypothetical protein